MKCFIIRLENNKLSCTTAQECFDQARLFGMEPYFFNAVDGTTAEYHYKKTNIVKNGKFKKNRPGVSGCFFSHFYLWEKCINLNETIAILEHDGYFIKKMPLDIEDKFEHVLKLDRHDPYRNNYNKLLEEEIEQEIKVVPYKNPLKKNVEKIGTGKEYFKGAYSYLLKPKGAERLVNWVYKNGHRPADQQIGSDIVDLKVTIPTVARLHPFYSIDDNIKTASTTRNLNETRL